RLIEDLLDYDNIQSGRLKIAPAPCAAAQLVEETAEMFAAAARDRGLSLVARAAEPLPALHCDRDRIIQALGNLISNAVKVSPPGGQVAVTAERSDSRVLLAVEDSGPGLAPEHLERVFDRYWRGDHSPYRGSGLGLAITRAIVEAHGGRV